MSRVDDEPHQPHELFDVIVVGAGICGVIFAKYARDRRLRCLVLEKQDDVGGLWKWLPEWQDIQNRAQDFAINGIPLDGVRKDDVHRYVRTWAREYQLEPDIRLGCEVFSVEWAGDRWHLETSDGRFQARYLVAASGIQNQPFVPDVDRFSSSLVEYHSSSLPASENLSGRRVTVVGGGASSWDLLDRAIESGASRVDWVYRETRWFLPTTKSKDAARPNLRELATMQVMNRSPEAVTERLRSFLSAKYRFFGLDDIEPEEPFDLRRHQLAPGRSAMIRNFGTIRRHKSEVRSIRGREVELASGERLETDVLLWGTGYRMNLYYLSLPELAGIRKVSELYPKLGSLVRSLDHPNLFFLGMSLIESTSATPFLAAIEARSIAAHVAGRCEIPLRPVHSHIAYWDLVRFFAAFDRSSYPPLFWRLGYTLMPWWNQTFQDRTVRI